MPTAPSMAGILTVILAVAASGCAADHSQPVPANTGSGNHIIDAGGTNDSGSVDAGEALDSGSTDGSIDCGAECNVQAPCLDSVFDGSFAIRNIDDMARLTGCTSITGDLIITDTRLVNLNGLQDMASVQGDLHIRFNRDLVDINGLSSLAHVGGSITVHGSEALVDLNGLTGLTFAGKSLHISGNDLLQDLDGLANLAIVGEMLIIALNPSLVRVDGLLNLETCETVAIQENDRLPTCQAMSLQEQLLDKGFSGSVIHCGNQMDECGGWFCPVLP